MTLTTNIYAKNIYGMGIISNGNNVSRSMAGAALTGEVVKN